MDVNVEVVPGTTGVFTNKAGPVSFIDRLLKVRGFLEEFTADVDVGSARVHRTSGHEATLD